MNQQARPSLRSRVLRHVLMPLAALWLAGSCASLFVANYFATLAFDRSMLDDAYSVAANVRLNGAGALELQLTPREVTAVLFDQVEKVFFAVQNLDGSVIAGNPAIRASRVPEGVDYVFADAVFQGVNLRQVVLRQSDPLPYLVVMAQTTTTRDGLLHRLLIYTIAPEMLLLLLLGWWLWRAIEKDLRPIEDLREAMETRGTNDLTPVSADASTRDVERLMSALNSLLARIEIGVTTQKEFVGNVAHELRTPLAGIRALAEYGLGHKDPAIWREQLGRIAQSQARASHLVDQLLALALAGEAQGSLALVPVRLDELVTAAVLRHLARADANQVDLGANGVGEEIWVEGDASLIEGMVDNLIDNSIRYGKRTDGKPSTVTVDVHRDEGAGGAVVLSVIDDGPGIPIEAQQQLLGRWAQGPDGQILGQGAGLGLSIVSRYAALLNATLALANGPDGRGLCVRVMFASATPDRSGISSSPDSR